MWWIFKKQRKSKQEPIKQKPMNIIDGGLVFSRPRTKLKNIKYIIIHHTANENQNWGLKECHEWHNKIRWNGIGYNYLVNKGKAYYGRSSAESEYIGSHVAGINSMSIGVCLTGHYSINTPSAEDLKTTAKLVKHLLEKYKLPTSAVKKHSDFSNKDCPGKLFPWQEFLTLLK